MLPSRTQRPCLVPSRMERRIAVHVCHLDIRVTLLPIPGVKKLEPSGTKIYLPSLNDSTGDNPFRNASG